MQTLLRSLAAFVFAGYSLAAPLLVVCHESGFGGEDRLEFAFASCCGDACCQEKGASHPDAPFLWGAGGCKACVDTPLERESVIQAAHESAAFGLLAARFPDEALRLQAPLPGATSCAPHPTGDQPLFLMHRSFRV